MDKASPLLEVRGVTKMFYATQALNQVGFDVLPGEVHALVGENGAGKSTLMLVMAGIHQPDEGQVIINGEPVVLRDPLHAQQLGVSLVFQELALSPNMSVAENVYTNTQPSGALGLIHFDEMYDGTRKSLKNFGVDIDPRAPLRNYNLAVQQIVEITRATQRQTNVLLLDEPTSAIGEREIERLYQVIRKLRERGVGIVYVSHKLDEIFEISDRITVLKDGNLMGTVKTSESNPDQIVAMMVGREMDNLYPPRNGNTRSKILEVQNISGKGFNDINFDAYTGEVLGVFGLSGSGRSEMARAIFGAESCQSGEVILSDEPIKCNHPKHAMRKGIAYVTEDRKLDGLFLKMSIKNNIAVTNLETVSDNILINNTKLGKLTQALAKQLSVKSHNLEQAVSYLSGGNQQKVLFAKWLARKPLVLIADEPTRGVDVGAKADIHALLRSHANQGAAVIMISSELPEIMGLSDRILVMRAGRVAGIFDADEATEEILVAHAAGASLAAKKME